MKPKKPNINYPSDASRLRTEAYLKESPKKLITNITYIGLFGVVLFSIFISLVFYIQKLQLENSQLRIENELFRASIKSDTTRQKHILFWHE